jgi:hypothetical protein
VALASVLVIPASAKIEEWKDPQGKAFKAEPAEDLGPFALFRTMTGGGIRLPWRALSAADCVRFEKQLEGRPDAAARWSDANGLLTGRLRGHMGEYEGVTLVTPKLELVPEPHLLIVFYVDNSASGAWDMISKSIAPYGALKAKYPGRIAALQYGVNHSPQEHSDMALRSQAPWLLVEYQDQRQIPSLFRLSPKRQDFALFALSRDGVPIFGTNNPDEAAVRQFFVDADALLGLLRPENPLGWQDRAHYIGALQATRHQGDRSGPVMIGNPLVAKGLRDRGIYRVAANIEVGADGKVTGVTLKEGDAIPEAMRKPLVTALQRSAVFAPAVDHGQFVAGTYDYLVEVPR